MRGKARRDRHDSDYWAESLGTSTTRDRMEDVAPWLGPPCFRPKVYVPTRSHNLLPRTCLISHPIASPHPQRKPWGVHPPDTALGDDGPEWHTFNITTTTGTTVQDTCAYNGAGGLGTRIWFLQSLSCCLRSQHFSKAT